jgi:hypothetical protein
LTSAVIATTSATSQISASQVNSEHLSSAALSTSQLPHGTDLDLAATMTSSASVSIAFATAAPSSLGQDSPPSSSISSSGNSPLVKIGPYICTTTVNLSTFTSQLLSYIQDTQNTLQARMLYVIINIHAAASDSTPTSPAPSPTILPQPSSLIAYQFNANLSSYLYTPSNLRAERSNLNNSWYGVPGLYRPANEYYETNSTQRQYSTEFCFLFSRWLKQSSRFDL